MRRTCVSVPERLEWAGCPADVVQIAALRSGERALAEIAERRGCPLPAPGRLKVAAGGVALCVSPKRWLLLRAPAAPGELAASWSGECEACAAVVDLSSSLSVLQLAGAARCEMLSRGCRLDLARQAFPDGSAAATVMAQVSVILGALPARMLLLTPATTARHFREWLAHTGQPFGLTARSDVTVASLHGDSG
jgi:heterotetrameric sarcosine oxidase gamma subunit